MIFISGHHRRLDRNLNRLLQEPRCPQHGIFLCWKVRALFDRLLPAWTNRLDLCRERMQHGRRETQHLGLCIRVEPLAFHAQIYAQEGLLYACLRFCMAAAGKFRKGQMPHDQQLELTGRFMGTVCSLDPTLYEDCSRMIDEISVCILASAIYFRLTKCMSYAASQTSHSVMQL